MMKSEELDKEVVREEADHLVTVGIYGTPYEAGLAKSALESYDIPAFVADEFTIGVNSLYSNALGGIKVNVPASRVEDACRILRQELLPQEEEIMRDIASSTPSFPKSLAWLYLLMGASGLIILIMQLIQE